MKKINRRLFLKKSSIATLSAAAFPTIIPSELFTRSSQSKPSDKIIIGCIGVGSMGTSNMRGFLGKQNAKIVAVCDVDDSRAQAAKKIVDSKYGNNDCQTYRDFRELLLRDDIDAIITATPDHWHALIAVAAARAGKDIYAEKPLAYNISEGRAIVNAVQKYGRIWQTGSWQRSQQHFRFACELVRNGRLGKIHTVRVGLPNGNGFSSESKKPAEVPEGFNYDMWLGPAPWRPYTPARCHWHFRWISDYSQGQLTDWAGHHCDIANWGMNTEHSAPVTIEGKAEYPPAKEGLYDTATSYYFTCEYKEGFKMIVADRNQQPKGMGAHFIGEKGWIHVKRGLLESYPKSILNSVIEPGEVHLYKSSDHYQNFLDCVHIRRETVTPVDVAHHSVMVGHLGHIAMKVGRKLKWDLSKEKFINDAEANRYLSRPMRSPWHF